jgi:hypothetical protein
VRLYKDCIDSKSFPIWLIILIVVGSLVVIALVIFLICKCTRRKYTVNQIEGNYLFKYLIMEYFLFLFLITKVT